MRAVLVPDKLTPLGPADVARAFRRAFFGITLNMPKDETLAILMAQSALESSRWRALHCNNFANVKASDTYEGFYCLYRCNEIINGKVEWFEPPHVQCRFRAFETVEDGALDYLNFLANRARYAAAWARALAGDAPGFVSALKRAGFFTASEEPYRKAVVSLTNEYMRQLPNWLDDEKPDDPPIPSELDTDANNDLRAHALAAATEARFALLEDLRHTSIAEPDDPDPDEITVPDLPSNV